MKMDKDKIKIKINEIWAVNQKVYPLGGLGISWSGNIGFGEYILRCGEDGMLRDEPYYWTMSLVGSEFTGAGSFSDVVLYFDDSIINVRINGRELQTVPYSADQNADEDDQVVSTEGFFCRDGWVTELKYSPGFNSDDQLSGTLLKEDGSTEDVIFLIADSFTECPLSAPSRSTRWISGAPSFSQTAAWAAGESP